MVPTREGGRFVVGIEARSAASWKEWLKVHTFKRKEKERKKTPQ